MTRVAPWALAVLVGAGLGLVVAGALPSLREEPCAAPACVGYAVEVERR